MAIRRPPTTFSDTISTADIADDAISGDKLANDIAISTTGNIATTGSGTLTVAGNTTLSGTNNLGSNPTLTLGSNATFPAGHIIQTLTDTHTVTGPITITTTSDDYLGSNLQITITPKANGNKLFIQALIHGINNNATDARSLHSGFAYDANFSSGNGTTIGPRAVIADYHNYINTNQGLLTNLQYSTIVTVGTNAPSAGSASIIRPIFQSTTGDITIAANSGAGLGVFSIIVMEIQA